MLIKLRLRHFLIIRHFLRFRKNLQCIKAITAVLKTTENCLLPSVKRIAVKSNAKLELLQFQPQQFLSVVQSPFLMKDSMLAQCVTYFSVYEETYVSSTVGSVFYFKKRAPFGNRFDDIFYETWTQGKDEVKTNPDGTLSFSVFENPSLRADGSVVPITDILLRRACNVSITCFLRQSVVLCVVKL